MYLKKVYRFLQKIIDEYQDSGYLKNNLKCWKPGLSHFKYLDMVVKKTSSSHYQVWPNYNARALAISLNSISIILRKIKLNNCDISGSWDFKKNNIFEKQKEIRKRYSKWVEIEKDHRVMINLISLQNYFSQLGAFRAVSLFAHAHLSSFPRRDLTKWRKSLQEEKITDSDVIIGYLTKY